MLARARLVSTRLAVAVVALFVLTVLGAPPAAAALTADVAAAVAADKAMIKTLYGGLEARLVLIRTQLREGKVDLATANIRQVTDVLKQGKDLTKRIRTVEPGFQPNLPLNFKDLPAATRQGDFREARKRQTAAVPLITQNCVDARKAVDSVKGRASATIYLVALKFAIDNAPGRQGGQIVDLVVEGVKRLNGWLMDKYVAEPITNKLNEADLIQRNMVKLEVARRLVTACEKNRDQVLALAKTLDADVKKLDPAVAAEQAWLAYKIDAPQAVYEIAIEIVDFQSRAMELSLNGQVLSAAVKGKKGKLSAPFVLSAKVRDARRQFCLDKRKYAQTAMTISLDDPIGEPEDSLDYRNTVTYDSVSWQIEQEGFDWKPSFNSKVEDYPLVPRAAYWKLERGRMRWTFPANAKPGDTVNVFVQGKVKWRHRSQIRNQPKEEFETNDGTATLVLKLL
ncbi:MAG: hypothetical protein ACOYOB_17320 [Myxococcota bacterium]